MKGVKEVYDKSVEKVERERRALEESKRVEEGYRIEMREGEEMIQRMQVER